MCDEIIDMPDNVSIDSFDEKTTFKIDYTFLSIIICLLLLIIITINCYYVKHRLNKKDIIA